MFGGSHARESVSEAAQLIRLQGGAPLFATASYAYLGAVAHEGIARMKLRPGSVLLVVGLGMLGQLAGKIAQLLGLRVIGVNRSAWKRDTAKAFGFDAVCAPEAGEIQAAVQALGFGPVKYAFDTTGNQPLIKLALSCLVPYGELSLGGYYPPQDYRVDWDFCHSRNLSIHSPVGWGGHAPDYVRFVDEGCLNIDPLIRHRIKPQDISRFYGDLVQNHSDCLGAVIDWRSE
jgi:threonine dehydrogenase-like Zn-dependent dehydrogenase